MNKPNAALLGGLFAAGAVLGYFIQADWAMANNEALGLGRLIAGAAGGGLLFVVASLIASLLMGRFTRRSWLSFWPAMAVVMCATVLLWLIPGRAQLDIGLAPAALVLALVAGGLAAWLHPRLSSLFLALLVLFSVAGVCLHDQQTRYYDRVCVEKVLKGNADAPTRYRLLVPWAVAGLEAAFEPDLGDAEAAVRAFAWFVLFLVSARVLALWVRGPLIWSGVFLHLALIPFSYSFRYSTDEAEILGVWLLLWCAASGALRAWPRQIAALAVVLFFALNRETMILMVPWFWACGMARDGWSLKNPAWAGAAAMLLGVAAEQFILVLAYGYDFQPADYLTSENIAMLWAWLRFLSPERFARHWSQGLGVLMSFAAGAWLVACLFWRRLPSPLRLGVLINFPLLFLVQTFLGRYQETRQLYLLMPFVVAPLVLLMARQDTNPEPA